MRATVRYNVGIYPLVIIDLQTGSEVSNQGWPDIEALIKELACVRSVSVSVDGKIISIQLMEAASHRTAEDVKEQARYICEKAGIRLIGTPRQIQS